ncbi:phage tail tip lysozyme [Intrasporangium flavum]|uniref:phage tail tip lysozyme n=1 Tax=Intrasporangium flavum TaxID=1428657 RepID=UPI00096FD38F|nr:phage tail tip lysozyme [Intrasporangium flavum]
MHRLARPTRARRVLTAVLAGASALVLGVAVAPSASAASNDEIAFDYFVGKGLTENQSAGIVGNLIQESGSPINPYADQPNGPGMGIAQWSEGGRWDHDASDNVVWYVGQSGRSRYDLTAQLDFTWYELSTFSGYGLADLRAATSVDTATTVFMQKFERCGTCATTQRIAYAKDALAKYGTGGSGGGGSTETALPTLRSGSQGTAVRTLQYLLRSRGYAVTADGVFGAGTDSAVRSYQSAHGLGSDGIVGTNTWNSILPVLRQGDSGDAVTGLQRELVDAGYALTVDGSFGPATDSAVRSYQQANGLLVDGVVGTNTWGSLVD